MVKRSNIGLSKNQITEFHRNGFIGPLPCFLNTIELDAIAEKTFAIVHRPGIHPLYGRFSVRDWHLLIPELRTLVAHPVVVGALRSLAGNNLNLWRSKIFHKRSRDNGTGWHQEWGAFNGEEIGNDKPSLKPLKPGDSWWNLTVWVALTDVGMDNAPMKFVRGSHTRRHPIDMAPMPESEFWHDPFIGCETVEDIVLRSTNYTLVLDIDTRHIFRGVDVGSLSLQQAKEHALRELSKMRAARTLGVDDTSPDIVVMPMTRGQFVIFSERTMHGSLPNNSDDERLAFNFRVTTTDTEVYPARHDGDYVDGSNLDIRRHRCVLLSGKDLSNGRNSYVEEV
jgi:non-heme Fe2+,alpha-ketoglutarate-dependent halogenase